MKVAYSNQSYILEHPSIFLAGPTPREPSRLSWRAEAVDTLSELNFEGMVFVPEHENPANKKYDLTDQAEWEYSALESVNVIVFWIPRNLVDLPGFTTNIEFGRYVGSGRCIYGRPDNSQGNRYLDWLYKKLEGKEPCKSLRETLSQAIILSR